MTGIQQHINPNHLSLVDHEQKKTNLLLGSSAGLHTSLETFSDQRTLGSECIK